LPIDRGDIGMKADVRYIDPSLFGCLQYGDTFSDADIYMINLYVRHDADLLTWVVGIEKIVAALFNCAAISLLN